MKEKTAPLAKGKRSFAAFRGHAFGAHFRDFTGLGRSAEDAALFFLVVGLFVHWLFSVLVVFGFFIYVVCSKKRLAASIRPRGSSLFLFAFLGAFFCYSLLIGRWDSAIGFFGIFAYVLLSFWVRSFMTRRRFARMLDLSIAMSFYLALYGVTDKFIVHSAEWEDYLMQSSCNNANYYGLLLVFSILAAFFRLEETYWRKRVFFYLGSVLINFIMLLFTESISSLFGLILGLLLLLFFYRHYKSFATLLGGLSAVFTFGSFMQNSPWSGTVLYTLLERVELWRIAVRSITDSPRNFFLGQGLFSYQGIWDRAPHSFWDVRGIVPRDFQPHAHNLYVELFLSVGLIGFLVLFAYSAFQVLLVLHRAKEPSLRPYSLFLLLNVAVVLFSGLADVSVFWMQTGMWLLLLCTCVGIPADRLSRPQEK